MSIETQVLNSFKNSDLNYNVTANFLGSGHTASKCAGSGEQYGKYKDVYYKINPKNNLTFTFSGPTKFDIVTPTLKSITKEAQEILENLFEQLPKKENITLEIKGHSRGGVVANNIYKWAMNKGIKIGKLSIADPYAGPINRRIQRKNDNFDNSNDKGTTIPKNKIVVYTVSEKRFRDPAQSLKSDIIIFTDTTHDKTKHISECVFNSNPILGKNKLYILADPDKLLTKMTRAVKQNTTLVEKNYINSWILKNLELINEQNIEKILAGNSKYKNFSYEKISSDGRRSLFYTSIAMKYKNSVQDFLINLGKKSMWEKVEKNLKKL